MNIYNKKWLLLLIPLTGILIAVFYYFLNWDIMNLYPLRYVIHSIVMTAGLWMGCFVIAAYLWKKYPWEREPIKHILYEIIYIVGYTILFASIVLLISFKTNFIPEDKITNIDVIFTFGITLFLTAIHEATFFYRQWKINFSKSVKLQNDNLEAKYEALKSQLNPHFLFNSLNSLLSIIEKNEAAVEYTQNLSDFLRYVLNSKEKEFVLLREEISMTKKYLQIQKLRFDKKLTYVFTVPESLYHYAIPPLTIQMLVENCIKHNVISGDKPLNIEIYADRDYVCVKNNLQKKEDFSSTGLGLKNIVERYRYFTSKEIIIRETSSIFEVAIPLLQIDL